MPKCQQKADNSVVLSQKKKMCNPIYDLFGVYFDFYNHLLFLTFKQVIALKQCFSKTQRARCYLLAKLRYIGAYTVGSWLLRKNVKNLI